MFRGAPLVGDGGRGVGAPAATVLGGLDNDAEDEDDIGKEVAEGLRVEGCGTQLINADIMMQCGSRFGR